MSFPGEGIDGMATKFALSGQCGVRLVFEFAFEWVDFQSSVNNPFRRDTIFTQSKILATFSSDERGDSQRHRTKFLNYMDFVIHSAIL